jgi:hypothetical protein
VKARQQVQQSDRVHTSSLHACMCVCRCMQQPAARGPVKTDATRTCHPHALSSWMRITDSPRGCCWLLQKHEASNTSTATRLRACANTAG